MAGRGVLDMNLTRSELAAATTDQGNLEGLYAALEAATARFDRERHEPRAAVLDALRALNTFLVATPHGSDGAFSRPLEVLIAELKHREEGLERQILPAPAAGKTGAQRNVVKHHIQAAAALAARWLLEAGLAQKSAEARVAAILEERHFPFGERRRNKADAIHAWDRDLPSAHPRRKKAAKGKRPSKTETTAAMAYKVYLKEKPNASGKSDADASAIEHWLIAIIERAAFRKRDVK